MWPPSSSPITTTSATDSRHGSSLEWCSYGPTNTTGRTAGASGRRSPSRATSLLTAAVAPEPQNSTTSSAEAPTARWMVARACSRSRPVCDPVAEASVCVFAYIGRTRSRMKSSTNPSPRPEAV